MSLKKFASGSVIAGLLVALPLGISLSARAGADDGFSMQVMDAFRITGRGTVLTGQVASGSVEVGDPVCVPLANGEVAARTVDGIEMFRNILDRAEKGQMVGLLVQVDHKQIEKGGVIHAGCAPEVAPE